jgi:ADP-L-glycero-D-manno-heptose 6-epimerase
MTGHVILVTGGAGFIGSNIVARLAADPGLDVVVCDRLGDAESGKWRNLAKHPIADFIAPAQLWPWLERRGGDVQVLVHMGAVSSTMERDVDEVIATNFGLSRDLFGWCAENRRRFIYASSAATYGDGSLGFDDSQDWRLLATLRPLNPYGWSKALFDVFAARQAGAGRAPPQWAGLKFFNVYGPNEAHKGPMRSVVSQIWPDVQAGLPVKLFASGNPSYPDGGQKRDFLYVDDAADVVAWLIDHAAVSGLFNLGSGLARSFKDLADAVAKAAGRESRIDYVEMPKTLRHRYQYFTQAKMERLRAAGYDRDMTTLEDGVGDYVARYLAKTDPYK